MSHLAERLRAALQPQRYPLRPGVRDAAVLMAISDEPDPWLLFIRRGLNLTQNPGEMAFPGGKSEPTDGDLYTTALREAEEEVALAAADFQFCGSLPRRETLAGIGVVAMVGIVPPSVMLRPDPSEVSALMRWPLRLFADASHLHTDRIWHAGQQRQVARYSFDSGMVWGMTAAFVVELVNGLYDAGLDADRYHPQVPWQETPTREETDDLSA